MFGKDNDKTVELPFKLGTRVRDSVSGWEGIATSFHYYMNGCLRVTVEGIDKDKEPKGYVFDIEQVFEVPGAKEVERRAPTPTGGPRDHTPPSR